MSIPYVLGPRNANYRPTESLAFRNTLHTVHPKHNEEDRIRKFLDVNGKGWRVYILHTYINNFDTTYKTWNTQYRQVAPTFIRFLRVTGIAYKIYADQSIVGQAA